MFATNVPAGTKVLGNWGAMFPIECGEVIRCAVANEEHLIRWSDGHESWCQIRTARSVNGSPIGVWQEKVQDQECQFCL